MRYHCFAVLLLISLPAAAEVTTSDLAQAAVRNDFNRFDALYQAAPDPQFAELHRFWSWSFHDPYGAFYGEETHDRLATLYPDYSAFISPLRVVDARGNVFYPSAETRLFLARRAGVPAAAVERPARRPDPVAVAIKAPSAAEETPELPRVEPLPVTAPARTPARAAPVKAEMLPPISDSGSILFIFMAIIAGVGMLTLMVQTPPERNSSTPAP